MSLHGMDLQGIATLISIPFSGLLAAFVSNWWHTRSNTLSTKRDVLRRYMGNRYLLTKGRMGQTGEPFVALNEAVIVFANNPPVIAALKKLKKEHNEDNRMMLVKAMAKAARLPTRKLDRDFFEYPFTPPAERPE